MEIGWSTVTNVIGVLTFVLSLGSFFLLVRDRFTICKVKVHFGRVTNYWEDAGGFHIPYKTKGLEVDVINLGKDSFFISKLEVHSKYLRDKPLAIALYDIIGGMTRTLKDRSELDSRRRFRTSIPFETLADYIELPHPKPKTIKVWVELKTEDGRKFQSNRLSVVTALIEHPETKQSDLQK